MNSPPHLNVIASQFKTMLQLAVGGLSIGVQACPVPVPVVLHPSKQGNCCWQHHHHQPCLSYHTNSPLPERTPPPILHYRTGSYFCLFSYSFLENWVIQQQQQVRIQELNNQNAAILENTNQEMMVMVDLLQAAGFLSLLATPSHSTCASKQAHWSNVKGQVVLVHV